MIDFRCDKFTNNRVKPSQVARPSSFQRLKRKTNTLVGHYSITRQTVHAPEKVHGQKTANYHNVALIIMLLSLGQPHKTKLGIRIIYPDSLLQHSFSVAQFNLLRRLVCIALVCSGPSHCTKHLFMLCTTRTSDPWNTAFQNTSTQRCSSTQ